MGEPVDNPPVKVLYVAGLGRSGSTILANTLGQVDGFFSGGELNFIWKHALIENRLCGCGRPARECPFWGPVFDEEFGGRNEDLAREMMRLQYSGARTRHIPLMLTENGREKIQARLGKFLDNTGRLYGAIRSFSGSRVVVDTSKEPAYGYALGMVPGIDLRVRYEDFIADPRTSFEAMLKLLGEEGAELPLVGEREVKLGISHTVSGNPNRFDTGAVELKQDRAWTEKMSTRDQRLVTALTVPLLKRYHYPLA